MKTELAKQLGSEWTKIIIINLRKRKTKAGRNSAWAKYPELSRLLVNSYQTTFGINELPSDFQISLSYKIKDGKTHVKILHESKQMTELLHERWDGYETYTSYCALLNNRIIDLTNNHVQCQCRRIDENKPQFRVKPLPDNSLYRDQNLRNLIQSALTLN